MNEYEFRRAYQASQQEIFVSDELKRRTLEFVEESRNQAVCWSPQAQATCQGQQAQEARQDRQAQGRASHQASRQVPSRANARPAARRTSSFRGFGDASAHARARRWALSAAACLVAVALVVGGVPALFSFGALGGRAPLSLQEAAEASGFSVRAYASDGSSVINPGEGDLIVFDRMQSFDASQGALEQLGGVFTGCLFRVEGEGIARVQMSVSGGELYWQVVEHIVRAEDPDRWEEAASWKESKRGLGEHYGAYDMVIVTDVLESGEDGAMGAAESDAADGAGNDASPDASGGAANDCLEVQLMKRYGSTVDVSAESDVGLASGVASFGLWAGADSLDAGSLGEGDVLEAAVDAFDGEELTVTVAFEDGRVATQVIKLHVADFKRADSGQPTAVASEKVSPEEADSHATTLRSVYGEVVSSSEQAFPGSLDNANEYADVLMATPALDRAEQTKAVLVSENGQERTATLADVELFDADGQAGFSYAEADEVEVGEDGFAESGKGHPVVMGRVSAACSALSPDGLTPNGFTATQCQWLGDFAYFNKCSQERYGYRFNSDGSLSDDGYCYVRVSLMMTNSGSDRVTVNGEQLGALGFADADGRLMRIDACYGALDVQVTGDAQVDGQDARFFTVQPGATAEVSLLYVVPTEFAASGNLLFLANDGVGNVPAAFSLESL